MNFINEYLFYILITSSIVFLFCVLLIWQIDRKPPKESPLKEEFENKMSAINLDVKSPES